MNISKHQLHQIIFWITGIVLLTYSTVRALRIPITIDEGTMYLVYVQGSIKDVFLNNPVNTNNHFLNVFLIKFTTWIFGDSEFSVRLPSLFGHLLYIVFSFKLLQAISNRTVVIIAGIILLHLNPYFLDFFGLARGYSLSWGLMMASMYYLYRYIQLEKNKCITISFVLAGLSVYSILIAMNYLLALIVAFNLIFLKSFFEKRVNTHFVIYFLKKNVPAILTSLTLFALLAHPISKIRKFNEFYGEHGSFFENTIMSLVNQSLYGKKYFGIDFPEVLAWIAIAVFLAVLIYSALAIFSHKKKNTSYIGSFIFSLLFTLACWSTIAQFHLIDTPYLADRTALIYYPLFSIIPVFFLSLFDGKKLLQIAFALLPILVYSYHFSKTANTFMVREWWFDSDNKDVLNYFLENENPIPERKVTFAISGLNSPSFHFYEKVWNLEDRVEMIRRDQLKKNEFFDYYYIEKHYMNQISEERYEIIKEFYSRALLKLKPLSPKEGE